METEKSNALKKYAHELFAQIRKAVDGDDEILATALYHKLEGVRSAAFLIDDFETDELIGRLITRLRELNHQWEVDY